MKSLTCSKLMCYKSCTKMKINTPTSKILPFQEFIRPALPTVYGNVDYTRLSDEIHRIDELLRLSGVERLFVEMSLESYHQRAQEAKTAIKTKALLNYQKHSFRALRCTILMSLLGENYRGMSQRLAECPLFRWFCGMEEMSHIRVAGKSTLQEYSNWLAPEKMRAVVEALLLASSHKEQPLNLANAIELQTVWMDTTCVKANVHFPVDWVLLRDGVRTLIKATLLIRKHGLKERMEAPEVFMTQMNRLSIAMTQNRRARDSKKRRKKTLRLMKRQVNIVSAHARRHRELLDKEWERSDWTRKQAEQVLRRIDCVLELLPLAKKQAHERIIGQRPVPNEDKILSLYEPELHVIVRGKAGAEVEFGNTLLLAEQKNGMILDWSLRQHAAPADCKQLAESVLRMEKLFGTEIIQALGADRGFESQKNIQLLESKNIYNAICAKDPHKLQQRIKEEKFAAIQKRRAQTEARIAIFKNAFLGRPLRAKGFGHRDTAIAWHVLTHNLWVLARLKQAPATSPPLEAVAA